MEVVSLLQVKHYAGASCHSKNWAIGNVPTKKTYCESSDDDYE